MSLPIILTTEPIVGANHPTIPDVKNRGGQYIATKILTGHNANGTHFDRNKFVCFPGTYTGNGVSGRNLMAAQPFYFPYEVVIWADIAAPKVIRFSTFPAGKSLTLPIPAAYLDDGIIDMALGILTIGDNYLVNDTGVVYHYYVLGYMVQTQTYTGDVGAGTDPLWIQHGEDLLGGNVGNEPVNRVEDHMYNTAFLHEHNDNGDHVLSPYQRWIAVGSYVGNSESGTPASRTITVSGAGEIPIKYVKIIEYYDLPIEGGNVFYRSVTMTESSAKHEAYADFEADTILSLGNGSFDVGPVCNRKNTFSGGTTTYFYMAIGGR